jgi:hypothetical protein
MSTNTQKNIEDQEIDVSIIFKKINGFFQGISTSIFRAIQFVIKNIIIIVILFGLGSGLGIYMDKTYKSFDHQIVVTPNFGSVDYLYSKIDLIESKIKENDTLFLKSIGIKNPQDLSLIEITPVIDIYSFVNNSAITTEKNSQNFELVKLLSEGSDINKVIKDKLTSRNYYHHTIHLVTNHYTTSEKTIKPILDYLNRNEYFEIIQKVENNNILIKMKKNEEVIDQINNLLAEFSTTSASNQKSDKLVYYNENTQLNEIIRTKNNMLVELGTQRMDLINFDKVIKKTSEVINIQNTKKLNNKLKLVLPILFIFIFICINFFINFYKKQSAKSKK